MPVAKEQIRQIIADNNLSSVADVYSVNVKSSACHCRLPAQTATCAIFGGHSVT